MAKLADFYRLIDKTEEAAACYSTIANKEGFSSTSQLNYAEVLMTLGKYAEAKKLLLEYQNSYPTNRSVANNIRSCDYADSLLKQPPTGVLYFESFNTDGYEFGPALRKDDLVFTTD